MTKNNTPTEFSEQCTLVSYLELKGLKFSALPLSTWTRSWNQKRKNHMSGVRAGVPDLLCIVPRPDGTNNLVFIELKRTKGGIVSEEQRDWVAALNLCIGVGAYVAKGADEAIKIIDDLMAI